MRTIKPPSFIIVVLVMLIIFLLSNNFSKPTRRIVKTIQPKAQPDSRSKDKLVQVLRTASMPDRTVILTIVDQSWASPGSILDLFLESFRIGQGTKPLLNYLVIVASDGKAFQYCKSIHPHCLSFTNSKKPSLMPPFKYKLFRQVIELGYSFFFTEADVMWLRNPTSHIHRKMELVIACNFYSDDLSSVNKNVDGGFFYMKSDEISLEFLKYRNWERVMYPNSENQTLCGATVTDGIFQLLDVQVAYLEEAHFDGFCQQRKDMSRTVTMRANCCDSIESKMHDLRLLLDDWRNFTALSRKKNSSGVSSFSWRAPSKCKE